MVTIHVNILSMHKHKQGRTLFFTPARFKSRLFFKFLLIYSKPCLVQLPRPYSFQKISWPPLDYLLWRRSGHFCQGISAEYTTPWTQSDLCPNFRYMDTSSKFVWLFTNEHEQVLKKLGSFIEECFLLRGHNWSYRYH